MAATMEYEKMASLCHAMEDFLAAIKNGKVQLDEPTNLLLECFDFLEESLKGVKKENKELPTETLIARLQVGTSTQPLTSADRHTGTSTPITSIPEIETINVKVERLDLLMKLAEELLIGKMRLDRIREDPKMEESHPDLAATIDSLSRVVTDLQYNIMQARMVPIRVVFDRFPRMVRDIAKQEKKVVELVMEGESLELDRSILNQIGEPLVHLLRNAVDHGVEPPEERKKAGKTEVASIRLSAVRERDSAVITVEDDGKGLDLEKIRAIALKRGIISPNAENEEVFQSIFSGISTAKEVTEISGRGLGLNIAKKRWWQLVVP